MKTRYRDYESLLPNLTGESTTFLNPAVLSCNMDLWSQFTLDQWKENKWRAHNNFCKKIKLKNALGTIKIVLKQGDSNSKQERRRRNWVD